MCSTYIWRDRVVSVLTAGMAGCIESELCLLQTHRVELKAATAALSVTLVQQVQPVKQNVPTLY